MTTTRWEGLVDPTEALKNLYNASEEIEEVEEQEIEKPTPTKKPTPVHKGVDVETEEETEEEEVVAKEPSLESIFGEDEDEEEEETETEVETNPSPEKTSKIGKKDVIRAIAEYNAEKYGIDVEGVEKWDEEALANLEDEIIQKQVAAKWDETKQSNELIGALADIAEAGGDTSDVLALFRQQRDLNSIAVDTTEGQLDYLQEYYTTIENWSVDRAKRYLAKLDGDEEIAAEFNEVKTTADEYFKTEREEQVAEAQRIQRQREEAVERHKKAFNTVLETNKYTKVQSRELHDFVFKPGFKITGTDQVLTPLDKELREIRKDPAKLLDLALMLKDRKAYEQKLITEHANKVNEEKFSTKMKKSQLVVRTAEGGKVEAEKTDKKPRIRLPEIK